MSWYGRPMPLKAVQKPPYTVEAAGAPSIPGETKPRRHPTAKDGLLERPAPEVDTVFALLKRSADKYADEPAVGSRKLVKVHKETKKVSKMVDGEPQMVDKEWTYLELSEYSYLTHAEYFDYLCHLGAGLKKLGMKSGDMLHIFAGTR
jgi:long-chain acyl-CoA synthetase